MGTIVTLVLLGLVGVCAAVAGRVYGRNDAGYRRLAYGISLVAFVLVVVFGGFNGTVTVDAKNVAIVTVFGRPVAVHGSGLHFVSPWSKVTNFDGTLQTKTLAGEKGGDNRVTVRISDQSTAGVNVTLQWRINVDDEAGVRALYADYHDPSKINEGFVERQLRAAVNDVFATHDPTAGLGNDRKQRAISDYGPEALENMKARMKTRGIELISLTTSDIAYDGKTQQRIDDLRALAAEKVAADLRREIAEKTAAANNALATGAKDAGTLYQLCLSMTEKVIAEGKQLPSAWSCGAPPAVVVPVK